MSTLAHTLDALAEKEILLLDRLCDEFDKHWQDVFRADSPRPRLEEFRERLPETVRWVGVRELLRVEWHQRRRGGERPEAGEYLERFPEHREVLVAMEGPDAGPTGDLAWPPPDDNSDGLLHDERDNIPGYRLLRLLGKGGMGKVYQAIQLFTRPDDAVRTVALKVIRSEWVASPRHRLLMENEIRLAALLDHPSIVPIWQVGPSDGPLYYTMRCMPGGSLARRINGKPLPPREAAQILLQVARAVAYSHSRKVIHLDLKPGNILLDDEGKPYVADFGLARLLSEDLATRLTEHPNGTPEYMPPEQFEGRVGPACDIYGLGAILYEMLTGRPPFRGANQIETMRQVCEQEVVPPRALNRLVDRPLQSICLRCLDKNPRYRYRSAEALADDLERYLAGERLVPVNWWDWLCSLLESGGRFERPDLWSRVAFTTAAYTLAGHLAFFGLLAVPVSGAICWLWFVLFEAGGWLTLLPLWKHRGRFDLGERGFLLNWAATVAADALLFRLFCPLYGPIQPELVVQVYPAWMVVHGLLWIIEARRYWGWFYLGGLAFFVAAALLPWFLSLAPVIHGATNAAVMVWLGLGLRRLTRAAGPAVPAVP